MKLDDLGPPDPEEERPAWLTDRRLNDLDNLPGPDSDDAHRTAFLGDGSAARLVGERLAERVWDRNGGLRGLRLTEAGLRLLWKLGRRRPTPKAKGEPRGLEPKHDGFRIRRTI